MSLPRTPGPTTSKSWEADPASPCDDIVLKPDLPPHSLASPLSALLAPKLVGGSHLPGPRSLLGGGPREPTLRRVAAARKSAGTEPLRPERTDTDPVFAILAPSRQRFTGELALDAFGPNCVFSIQKTATGRGREAPATGGDGVGRHARSGGNGEGSSPPKGHDLGVAPLKIGAEGSREG